VGHNPRVPSHDRFPHARRERRGPARRLLIAAGAGLAVLLAIPLVAGLGDQPAGGVARHAVSGQEPTPAGTAALRSAAPTGAPADPVTGQDSSDAFAPAASAAPASAAPAPFASTAPAPAVSHGVPPERAWVEWTGTRAPALDRLQGYRWPLAHPRLTLPFGPTPWGSRLVGGKPFHDGVDLATFCNDRVLAAHSGTVLAAGRHYDEVMGWIGDLQPYYNRLDRQHLWYQLPIVVVIDDGNGYRSMYAHMWWIDVKKGDVVKAGQVIGREGMTGRASGCHLHYGLFSPWETATFRMKPDVVKRMKLPKAETARVDPLLVLPPRAGINAPAKPKASASPTAPPAP
jgi:murein DD-endopeptidase MepM/ murein hydrolase activator NlpD